MNKTNSFFPVFISTFKTFSCLFILILLPLSFLYYLDSYLLLSTKQLILDTAIMVIFFALLAFIGALFAGIICFLLAFFLKKENVANIIIFYNMLGFVIVAYEFFKTLKLWLSKVFQFVFFTPSSLKIILLILCIASVIFVFLFRDKIMPRLKVEIDRWFKAVIVVASVAITIIIFQIVYTYFFNAPRNIIANTLQADKGESNRPNVILITFDALTAEDMSLYGYKLKTTPNLDLFAKGSYVFQNMYANSNWTRPAVASILTGTYPSTHRLINTGTNNCFLPEKLKNKNIAAILNNNGYQTVAIVSNRTYAHPSTNDTFNSFDYAPIKTIDSEYLKRDPLWLPLRQLAPLFLSINSAAHTWMYNFTQIYSKLTGSILHIFQLNKWNTESGRPAEFTFDLGCRYLKEAKSPFFLWIHLYPPHAPYLPPDEVKKQFLTENILLTEKDQSFADEYEKSFYPDKLKMDIDKLRLRYDEYILYADHEFSRFLSKLKDNGYLNTSIIIISSDHGESFNHNVIRHDGPTLYNDLIHIPLIIHMPKQKKHIEIVQPAEHVDIAPTILDLLRIDIPPWMEGESVKKSIENKNTMTSKPKFSMQLDGNKVYGPLKKGTVAVIKDKYKYIYYINSQKSELYNLVSDQQELINLAEIEKERSDAMKSLILRKISVQ